MKAAEVDRRRFWLRATLLQQGLANILSVNHPSPTARKRPLDLFVTPYNWQKISFIAESFLV